MVASDPLVLEQRRYDDEVSHGLIEELQAEYVVRYGSADETPVQPQEFSPPGGAFYVARLSGEVVGCGGLRRHDQDQVEIKRMFVRRPFRGQGVARALLAGLEDAARTTGYRTVLAETGLEQPEAIGLYEACGYQRVPGFGFYKDSPRNRCYAKDL